MSRKLDLSLIIKSKIFFFNIGKIMTEKIFKKISYPMYILTLIEYLTAKVMLPSQNKYSCPKLKKMDSQCEKRIKIVKYLMYKNSIRTVAHCRILKGRLHEQEVVIQTHFQTGKDP